MRMGGGPQQFGVDAEQVPALLSQLAAADLDVPRVPRLRRVAEPAARRSSARRSARPCDLMLALADKCPSRSATSTSAAASASRTSTRTSRSTSRPIGATSASCSTVAIAPEPARRARRHRAGPLHRRRVRRLRHPGRRPQGVARPHVSGGRRRPAPPAGRVRQLRPGDPAQLPDRGGQPHGRARRPRRSPSSAACARRSTCWATMSALPHAEIGDLVVVFQAGAYGLTASPTAFLGHPATGRGARINDVRASALADKWRTRSDMDTGTGLIDDVIDVVATTLGIEDPGAASHGGLRAARQPARAGLDGDRRTDRRLGGPLRLRGR